MRVFVLIRLIAICMLAAGTVLNAEPSSLAAAEARPPAVATAATIMKYKFVNELGQPVSLADFRGDVVAMTFFFTRCPMPQFCPRLSRNFQEASRILRETKGGFTNWHFLSVTFDPEFDTPAVLKAYGERYDYDPREWSFLTGPKEQIAALVRLAGVKAEPDGGLINHNFRTLIFDAEGRVRTIFPTGGNLTDDIVAEMRKAAGPPTHLTKAENRVAPDTAPKN